MLSLFCRGSKTRRERKALVQGDSKGGLGWLDQNVSCPGVLWRKCKPREWRSSGSEVSVEPNVIVLVRLCSLRVENEKKLLGRKELSKAGLESKKIK